MNGIPISNERIVSIDRSAAPTADAEVRKVLRQMKEPVTYFGEDAADRRNRLLKLLSEKPNTNFDDMEVEEESASEESESDDEFYTPGTKELLEARKNIVTYSLNQAQTRIRRLQQEYESDFVKVLKHRRIVNANASKIKAFGVQLLPRNQRPLSTIRYNHNGSLIACLSWDGNLYLVDSQLGNAQKLNPGYHSEKVSGLDWSQDTIVTGGGEGKVNFWNSRDISKPIHTINAHNGRIAKTIFHPSSKYIVSTSFDQTWKLWDVETQTELVQQEGHLKEVFLASFHPDGGILATGGVDALAKLWDLRSGKLITDLSSHIQGIYAMDWSSNGYHLATGSADSSIKIWDLRNTKKETTSVAAHKKLVSDIRFYNCMDIDAQKLNQPVGDIDENNSTKLSCSGQILVSSSYDGTISLHSSDNWIKVGELANDDKVMGCDISQSGQEIVSCHWNRSVKLWKS